VRSYGQYCAVARSLDILGDRWTLLIVRELLTRGACRYTDLLHGLPGIATNLLADRLRELEDAGVVVREAAPPPVATTLIDLTDRGRALAPMMQEIVRWGAPLMVEPVGEDTFRSHWLRLPAETFLSDTMPERPPVTIEVRSGDAPMLIEVGAGAVLTRPKSAERADAVLSGPPQIVLGLLSGMLDLPAARRRGVRYAGDVETLERVQPRAVRRRD
jgi:DNA-binding HxlR family transcriptional regulator